MDDRAAPNINILSFKAHEESALSSFLNWSLKYGRVIVIITEFLVIAAFLSRFFFDYRLTDLHDTIDERTAYIEQLKTVESEFLQLQSTVNAADILLSEQHNFATLYGNLLAIKPGDLILKELELNGETGRFVATTTNTASLAAFLAGLNQGGKFTNISLEDVTAKDGALSVAGQFTITPEGFK